MYIVLISILFQNFKFENETFHFWVNIAESDELSVCRQNKIQNWTSDIRNSLTTISHVRLTFNKINERKWIHWAL